MADINALASLYNPKDNTVTAQNSMPDNPNVRGDNILNLASLYKGDQPLTNTQKLQVGSQLGSPLGIGVQAAKGIGRDLTNTIAQRSKDFLFGGDSMYGMGGDIARTVPIADVGALMRVGGAVAKPGMIGNMLSKAGNFLNPTSASSVGSALSKSALGGGLSAGALTAGSNLAEGQPITQNVGTASALGAIANPALTGLLNAGKIGALNILNKNDRVKGFIDTLSGNANSKMLQGKALQANDQVRALNQKLSGDNYQNLWAKADNLGITGNNTANLASKGTELENNIIKDLPQDQAFLKDEVKTAQSLFGDEPVSLNALDKKRSYYNARARELAPTNKTAASVYNQLGQAADEDITNALKDTPLRAELDKARSFHRQQVVPLDDFKQMATNNDTKGMLRMLTNPENADMFKALEAHPEQVGHQEELNKIIKRLGTTPQNLNKAALMSQVEADTGLFHPENTIKKYLTLTNVPHLFQPQKEGQKALFNHQDALKLRELAKEFGVNVDKIKPEDVAYLGGELAHHTGLGFWPSVYARTAGIGTKLFPSGQGALHSPDVMNALIKGGSQAAKDQLKNKISPFPAASVINPTIMMLMNKLGNI